MNKPFLSEERILAAYREYTDSTKTIAQVAKPHGIGGEALARYFRRRDLPIRPRGWNNSVIAKRRAAPCKITAEQVREAHHRYWDGGEPAEDLAAAYGVTYQTIMDRFRSMGLPRRLPNQHKPGTQMARVASTASWRCCGSLKSISPCFCRQPVSVIPRLRVVA